MPSDKKYEIVQVRDRKPKDKDNRSIISGASRKHRDSSSSSSRASVPSESSSQPLLYSQSTVTLDQLPPLPETPTDGQSTSTSPIARSHSNISISDSIPRSSPSQIYTPAALQPYLESEVDLPSTLSAYQTTIDKEEREHVLDLRTPTPSVFDLPLDSQATTPVQKLPQESLGNRPLPVSSASSQVPPIGEASHFESVNSPESATAISESNAKTVLSKSSDKRSSGEPTPSKPLGKKRSLGEHSHRSSRMEDPFQPSSNAAGHPADRSNIIPPMHPYYLEYGPQYPVQAPPQTMQAPSQMMRSPLPLMQSPPPLMQPPAPLMQPPFQPLYNFQAEAESPFMSSWGGWATDSSPRPPPSTNLTHRTPPDQSRGRALDGSAALLHRVGSVIPDLYYILNQHQYTCGLLDSREAQISDMEAQRIVEVNRMDARIDQLEKDVKSLLSRHSTETDKLRHEIDDISKKNRELRDRLSAEMAQNQATAAVNEALRAKQKEAEKRYQAERDMTSQAFALEKDTMVAKSVAVHQSWNDQLQADAQKAEAILSARIAETMRVNEQEKQTLEACWMQEKRELEHGYTRSREEPELMLRVKEKVLDEERRIYSQMKGAWDRERDSMRQQWDEERACLSRESEEQCRDLFVRHQREKDEVFKTWDMSQSRQLKEAQDEHVKLQKELETLRKGSDAEKAKLQRITTDSEKVNAEIASLKSGWASDKGKLQKAIADAKRWQTECEAMQAEWSADEMEFHEAAPELTSHFHVDRTRLDRSAERSRPLEHDVERQSIPEGLSLPDSGSKYDNKIPQAGTSESQKGRKQSEIPKPTSPDEKRKSPGPSADVLKARKDLETASLGRSDSKRSVQGGTTDPQKLRKEVEHPKTGRSNDEKSSSGLKRDPSKSRKEVELPKATSSDDRKSHGSSTDGKSTGKTASEGHHKASKLIKASGDILNSRDALR